MSIVSKVSWDLRALHATPDGIVVSLLFRIESYVGGLLSAQKILQWSKTESWVMLGGTKDNILPHEGSLIGPPFESVIFNKKQTKLH